MSHCLAVICLSTYYLSFFFYWSADHPDLHSFPTRRSSDLTIQEAPSADRDRHRCSWVALCIVRSVPPCSRCRSEEHTSELQSLRHLVCRLLLEKKKIKI